MNEISKEFLRQWLRMGINEYKKSAASLRGAHLISIAQIKYGYISVDPKLRSEVEEVIDIMVNVLNECENSIQQAFQDAVTLLERKLEEIE